MDAAELEAFPQQLQEEEEEAEAEVSLEDVEHCAKLNCLESELHFSLSKLMIVC